MVKLTLTFKQLVSYLYDEIPNKLDFELLFISKLHSKSSLLNMRLPAPIDYSLALLESVNELTFPVSSTLRKLISDYHSVASSFIIPNKHRPNMKESPQAKSFSKLKPSKTTASRSSVSEIRQPSTHKDCSTNLSAKKIKKLKKGIEDTVLNKTKLYSSCKADSCKEVCPRIACTAPLTACTHPNPHPGGVYPHVSRNVIRKIHKFGDFKLLLTLKGIPNPLNDKSSEERNDQVMEVVSAPVAEQASEVAAPTSKKRRLEETSDSQWQWVGNALRANPSDRGLLICMLKALQNSGAPQQLLSNLQRWETLSEAERKTV